jgi:hypothetical protein
MTPAAPPLRATRLTWFEVERHCPVCHWPDPLACGPHCADPVWPYALEDWWK